MDNQNPLVGVIFGVIGSATLIVSIIIGGSFRTEVTFIPPTIVQTGEQIPFEENLDAKHWFLGLMQGKQPDLQEALAKYVRPGEQITKMTILTKHSWLDQLVTGLTLFIYCPETVIVKGTISRTIKRIPE